MKITLLSDLRNKGANSNKKKFDLANGLELMFFMIIGLSNLIDKLENVIIDLLGVNGVFLQPVFLLITLLWSIYVITNKKLARVKPYTGNASGELNIYVYPNFIRLISKALLFICLFLVPFSFKNTIYTIKPFQNKEIYGYIFDNYNAPIIYARVRLIDKNGADMTDGEWYTDTDGYYIVRANREIYRDSKLKIILDDCATVHLLTLHNSHLNSNINYNHFVNTCP